MADGKKQVAARLEKRANPARIAAVPTNCQARRETAITRIHDVPTSLGIESAAHGPGVFPERSLVECGRSRPRRQAHRGVTPGIQADQQGKSEAARRRILGTVSTYPLPGVPRSVP